RHLWRRCCRCRLGGRLRRGRFGPAGNQTGWSPGDRQRLGLVLILAWCSWLGTELRACATTGPQAGATLGRSSPASYISILSGRVGLGTERTRGESWYQTPAGAGRPAFPARSGTPDWVCLLCASGASPKLRRCAPV